MLPTFNRVIARPTSLAAAVTLAGAGFLLPISTAQAATTEVTLPAATNLKTLFSVTDGAGFLNDAFTAPTTTSPHPPPRA